MNTATREITDNKGCIRTRRGEGRFTPVGFGAGFRIPSCRNLIEIIAVQRNRAFRTIKQDPDAALVDAAVADDCPLLTGKPQAALGATVVNPYTGPDVDFNSSRPSAHYAVSSEVFKTGDDILRAINKNLAATVIATGRASIKENKTVRGSAQGPGLIN